MNINDSIEKMVSNWKSISSDVIQTLADALGMNYMDVIKTLGLELNKDGTYKMNPSKIRGLVSASTHLTEETKQAILDKFAEIE